MGLVQERAREEAAYDRIWTDNIFGFRSTIDDVRGTGKRRIVTLGDSFTWGDKILSTDDTWPARLQAALDFGHEGEFEVINMARRGYTTLNEAETLRRIGWQFDPEVVILQFFINDALESGPNFDRGGHTQPYQLVPQRFRTPLIAKSALLDATEQVLLKLHFRWGGTQAGWQGLYEDEAPGWKQMQLAFAEIGAGAAERGVPVLFVIFPYLYPGEWTAET
jgi:hypothetical protein